MEEDANAPGHTPVNHAMRHNAPKTRLAGGIGRHEEVGKRIN